MLRKIILITLVFILFSGCAQLENSTKTISTQTPAAKLPVKAKVTPNVEVKTKYSYRVFGKTYKVMNSSKNYEAVGTASWYGKKFHRKRTATGERFNMYTLSAAHKTLPLPTYVQVTNLKNGRKIVVKVNDRGPFISNRLIDLSYAAAKKLGMVNQGIISVKVKAIARA